MQSALVRTLCFLLTWHLKVRIFILSLFIQTILEVKKVKRALHFHNCSISYHQQPNFILYDFFRNCSTCHSVTTGQGTPAVPCSTQLSPPCQAWKLQNSPPVASLQICSSKTDLVLWKLSKVSHVFLSLIISYFQGV